MCLSMTNMIFCFSQSSKLINLNSKLAKVEYSSFKQISPLTGFMKVYASLSSDISSHICHTQYREHNQLPEIQLHLAKLHLPDIIL